MQGSLKSVLVLVFLFSFSMFLMAGGNDEKPKDKDFFKGVDTAIIPQSYYKLNRAEFLKRYAFDDTSKAIVNIFFNDRRNGFLLLPAYPLFVVLPTLLFVQNPTAAEVFLGQRQNWLLPTVGILGTATGGFITYTYTRKRLYMILQDYRRNRNVPTGFRERVEYRVEKLRREQILRERKERLRLEKEKQKEESGKAK